MKIVVKISDNQVNLLAVLNHFLLYLNLYFPFSSSNITYFLVFFIYSYLNPLYFLLFIYHLFHSFYYLILPYLYFIHYYYFLPSIFLLFLIPSFLIYPLIHYSFLIIFHIFAADS